MATMQLYKNLGEITEIVEKCGKYAEKIENYAKVKRNIENGVEKYAIVEKDGIKKSYTVGATNYRSKWVVFAITTVYRETVRLPTRFSFCRG